MAAFTNRATISWGDTIRDSNVVTGEIVEVLSMTKNASRTTYLPGDTVTYIISIRNNGSTAFTGLTVTDDLAADSVQRKVVSCCCRASAHIIRDHYIKRCKVLR